LCVFVLFACLVPRGAVPKVSLDLSLAIQRGRLDKKLTQKELAQLINEKVWWWWLVQFPSPEVLLPVPPV
jgi:hypothetical protein